MEKTIYGGEDNGLFVIGNFKRFMNRFKGARNILSSANLSSPAFYIYHIFPQNVTVKYFCWCGGSDGSSYPTEVSLYGDEKAVSEIERIVLEEAKRYE